MQHDLAKPALPAKPAGPLFRSAALGALLAWACAVFPAQAQTTSPPLGPVTVVVEVALAPKTTSAEALVAVNDMRAMMKRQAGYLSEELLQNLNAENTPRFVHVSRWASIAHWAALFNAPEFAKLNTHGNTHYTISASAFVPVP